MIPEHTDAALAALEPDLVARLRFVLEADAHSWYLALMALVLAPYSREPIDVSRVIEMLLVHDIVEIDAGDTFVYDAEARAQKEQLEQRAADRLFAMVPGDDGSRLRARWDEFEAGATPEARFAHSLDRLAPLLLNHANRGELWADYGITADRVFALNGHIADGSPDLWIAARSLLDDAIAQGWLEPGG